MKSFWFIGCLFLVTTTSLFSQLTDKKKLDSYFESLETHTKYMGSVAISQNGKVIYTKTIGYADVASKTKPNDATKYRIGSISKTFTTVLLFKAIEEKKLTLTQTIKTYFPTIKNAEKITLAHLISHRSGIHNFTDDASFQTWYTQKKTEEEMVSLIATGGSDFEPDSKADYSNANFVLLTYILEKTYKKDYATLLKEKIVNPIGLKNTYLGSKINLSNNECNSYSFSTLTKNWEIEKETDISIPLGAGGIVSTPSDLLQFAQHLFNGKIISIASLAQMKTIKEDYGMGLFEMPFNDTIGFGHTGGIDGFSSLFSYYPKNGIGIAMISNGNEYGSKEISLTLLRAVYDLPYQVPTFQSYNYENDDVAGFLGTYSNTKFPLKITISKADKKLMAQATGQSAFPLDGVEKGKFKFEAAGIELEFISDKNQMTLKQGGQTTLFTKE